MSGRSAGPEGPPQRTDPELEALPKPRRPWRTATLLALCLVGLSATALILALRSQLQYALRSGQPTEVGTLSAYAPEAHAKNTWVHGSGNLSAHAVGYRRPLDADRFRLAPVEGNPNLWVELREPEDARSEYFVPPTSFVGRLVPLASPGLRHSDLRRALASSGQAVPSESAWLLIDGEAPATTRWVLGLSALLVAFVGFSAVGLWSLLRPSHERAVQ